MCMSFYAKLIAQFRVTSREKDHRYKRQFRPTPDSPANCHNKAVHTNICRLLHGPYQIRPQGHLLTPILFLGHGENTLWLFLECSGVKNRIKTCLSYLYFDLDIALGMTCKLLLCFVQHFSLETSHNDSDAFHSEKVPTYHQFSDSKPRRLLFSPDQYLTFDSLYYALSYTVHSG